RPVSSWERMRKWARKRPAAAALFVVSALAVLTVLGGGLWYNARLQRSLDETRKAKAEAERLLEELNHQLSMSNLRLLGVAMLTHHDKTRKLPAVAIFNPEGRPLLSWRVALLPSLGNKEGELYSGEGRRSR